MNSRKFALFGGLLMLILGVLSMIPAFAGPSTSLPDLRIETSYGLFLGVFPLNIVNKLALVIFGIAGIQSSRKTSVIHPIKYSRTVFFMMGTLALLGVIPQTSTLGGLWPLFGAEVIAHGLFAIVAEACVLVDTRGGARTTAV